ncbi:MAG: hypothetical protein MUP11_00760 [Anaerolineales bacterium]|nr:hypothetical protein [Anaerolineales bacterium]
MKNAEVNIYQIYYDESQKEYLYLDTIPLFNDELSLYFENNVILDLYKKGKIEGDFFGVLSWKNRIKNKIRSKKIKKFIRNDFDIYSFTYDRHDVLGYAQLCHSKFMSIFSSLLEYLNLDPGITPRIGLYQNAIIAKPKIYIDYVENYLMPAIVFLENSPEVIKESLYADAEYRGVSKEVLIDSFGLDHYPYHTFLLERLWSVYYQINRNKQSNQYFISKLIPGSFRVKKVDTKGKIHKFNL